jgi:glucosyl-3-phosphoglycerate synthase
VSDDGSMGQASTPRGGAHLYRYADFAVGNLVTAKEGRRISVCIPARNEATTVGAVVTTIVGELTEAAGIPLVDEVIVTDDSSSDATAEVAARAGARVVEAGAPHGKGQAMRRALDASHGDLVVFVDADVSNFASHFVTGLLGPLLTDDSVTLVKGAYERPLHGNPDGGGRVTELAAKPIIDLLFPSLAVVEQPLAGETAAPRPVLEKCGLADGYAVELALLIDVASRFGIDTVAQVDLGTRVHRNRPLAELRPQATDVLRAALDRAAVVPPDQR